MVLNYFSNQVAKICTSSDLTTTMGSSGLNTDLNVSSRYIKFKFGSPIAIYMD